MRAVAAGIALVLLFLVVQALAVGALVVAGVDLDLQGRVGMEVVLALAAVQLLGVLGALGMARIISTSRRVGLDAPRGSFGVGLQALLPVGLLVILPTMGVVLATGGRLLDAKLDPPLALAFVALATLIAVNEELWFRGLVYDQLDRTRRPWLTVIASAVLFGAPHAGGGTAALLNALAVTLAVGIPFAVVRMRCGSILPLIAWHAIIDTWAFLHTASVVPEGSPSVDEMAASLVLPLLVAIGYLTWLARSGPARFGSGDAPSG